MLWKSVRFLPGSKSLLEIRIPMRMKEYAHERDFLKLNNRETNAVQQSRKILMYFSKQNGFPGGNVTLAYSFYF